nr:hypothetical protein Iba_chr14cCG8230 [Ipomoea batatas]
MAAVCNEAITPASEQEFYGFGTSLQIRLNRILLGALLAFPFLLAVFRAQICPLLTVEGGGYGGGGYGRQWRLLAVAAARRQRCTLLLDMTDDGMTDCVDVWHAEYQ